MKSKFVNKKRTVEIYFVLYLAALMLLIPDLKEKSNEKNEVNIDNNLFRIYTEKQILYSRISIDSSGIESISSDSVNSIYYVGNVKLIDFSFQVENKAFNQIINISQGSNIWNFFRYNEVPDLKTVFFYWKPPLLDKKNYVYNVKVTAKADVEVFDNNTQSNIIRKLQSTTQFSLVVNYYDNQTRQLIAKNEDSTKDQNQLPANYITYNTNSEIFLDIENKKISNLTNDEWTNKITVWGLNLKNELGEKPEISIYNSPDKNNGSVYIKQITDNSIILAGKTPQFGSSRVKIRLTRKSDKSSVTNEFVIYPIPIIEPNFPSIMYPLITYKFELLLPDLINKNILTKIVSDNKVINSTFNNTNFYFSINEDLTGKTIYFERYIDGNLYGKSYPILVKQFPDPVITRIQASGSQKVKVIIHSFGIANGNENYIKNIELSGNGTYEEIIGQSTINKSNYTITQVYEVTLKNVQQPFEFKIRAQDNRGKWSNKESYP